MRTGARPIPRRPIPAYLALQEFGQETGPLRLGNLVQLPEELTVAGRLHRGARQHVVQNRRPLFFSISIVVQGGFVIGVVVLLDTFPVRTITVPAMATLVGRANWWPSRLSSHVGSTE